MVRPPAVIQSAGTRWMRQTRMWWPPLRWANRPRSPSAAAALPWPTSSANLGPGAVGADDGIGFDGGAAREVQQPGAFGGAADVLQRVAPAHGAGLERVEQQVA
ncbi:hypothetical protein [Nonomuraea gerenzanensis]|uniref:hypothetical protein n=1 Tax=Nonomuraea gerenzanensis TaxID=93944 RepID=UPI001CD99398|nr:hypothetical protein [Nonomuraea gerenzanensis]UBU18458.1 hypothetical protein LCN96_26595 [Nonomuraea gerenzanensis]